MHAPNPFLAHHFFVPHTGAAEAQRHAQTRKQTFAAIHCE